MPQQTLRGSCACGRNRYVVEVPQEQASRAELRYDNTAASVASLLEQAVTFAGNQD